MVDQYPEHTLMTLEELARRIKGLMPGQCFHARISPRTTCGQVRDETRVLCCLAGVGIYTIKKSCNNCDPSSQGHFLVVSRAQGSTFN